MALAQKIESQREAQKVYLTQLRKGFKACHVAWLAWNGHGYKWRIISPYSTEHNQVKQLLHQKRPSIKITEDTVTNITDLSRDIRKLSDVVCRHLHISNSKSQASQLCHVRVWAFSKTINKLESNEDIWAAKNTLKDAAYEMDQLAHEADESHLIAELAYTQLNALSERLEQAYTRYQECLNSANPKVRTTTWE